MYRRTAALICALLIAASSAAAQAGRAVPGDYDGDGRTDIVVVRPINGFYHWFLRTAYGTEFPGFLFGLAGSPNPGRDTLLAADYDGDGDYGIGVVRTENTGGLTWYQLNNDTVRAVSWGLRGDTPLVGYFDNDTAHDLVVVRKTANFLYWYILLSGGGDVGVAAPLQLGLGTSTPYVGDLDGDGIDEIIVAQDEAGQIKWYAKKIDGTAVGPISWGLRGDTTLPPFDVNGDGISDLIVVRALNGTHLSALIRIGAADGSAADQQIISNFGLRNDTPYVGRFSGQQRAEAAAFRGGSNGFGVFYVTMGDFVAPVPYGLARDTVLLPNGTAAGISRSGLSEVCPTIVPVTQGFLWKPSSDHSGAPRVGRPLIIVTRNKPRPQYSCLRVFAEDGQAISRLGLYEYDGRYGGTWYSGWGCGDLKYAGQMAVAAQAQAGSPNVYVERGDGVCVGPLNPNYRSGSR